jgi:DNA-binding response OmpR family regulator
VTNVKAHAASAATYVIVVTGLNDAKTKIQGFDAGADDYLIKPFDKIELLARVRVGLRVREMQKSLSANVNILQQAIEQSPVSTAITDAAGNIEYANARYVQTAGIPASKILGRHIATLLAFHPGVPATGV